MIKIKWFQSGLHILHPYVQQNKITAGNFNDKWIYLEMDDERTYISMYIEIKKPDGNSISSEIKVPITNIAWYEEQNIDKD